MKHNAGDQKFPRCVHDSITANVQPDILLKKDSKLSILLLSLKFHE